MDTALPARGLQTRVGGLGQVYVILMCVGADKTQT